jgi:hypothetical protein
MRGHPVRIFSVLALLLGIIVLLGAGSQIPAQLQHDVTVVNIAVPVRVFDGDRFVDNLTMNDFEVYENGVLQKVEAAYLIRKTTVLRNATIDNGPPSFVPIVQPDEKIKNRHFLLIFEMDEYLPQLGNAIDLFFSDVLAPNDTVRILTPEKMWELKKGPRDKATRGKLAEDIKSKIRNSLIVSGSQLRQLMVNLRMASRSVLEQGEELDVAIYNARILIQQVVSMKTMNISQYEQFAKSIKPLDGQKYAFIFYQKEFYVIPDLFKDVFMEEAENRRDFIDKKEIQKIFADADTTANFLFLTKTKTALNDVEWKDKDKPVSVEMGGDFFQAFRNLADATGGISESTANPIYGFKKALDATENFYLVYYKPANYKADGKYKDIEVKLKGGSYQVSHRAGYIDK